MSLELSKEPTHHHEFCAIARRPSECTDNEATRSSIAMSVLLVSES